jgi:hypothetical protein
MKRTLYVHSYKEVNYPSFKASKRKLPHDKQSFYLYEVVCEEEKFSNI